MAKTDIWMPIYINDYIGDTMELDENGHGIYLMLMFHYWKKGPLTKDTSKLKRIARTENIDLLSDILDDYFIDSGERYVHKRIEEEKEKANSRRDSASLNGKKGGRPKVNNNPQKTHSFNEGKPTENPKHNPQESSSSSPSSSSLPTTSKSTTPTDLMRCVWEHWNNKDNLPNDPYMPTSMRDPRRLLDVIQGHGVEKVKECIDKLDRIYPSLDKKPSTPGSLLSNNSITHWLNVEEEKTITESEKAENDRIAMEVFG